MSGCNCCLCCTCCFCHLTAEEKKRKRINEKIEKQLKKDQEAEKRIFKILLLGTGESGKSTFIKQMRIINRDKKEKVAYTDDDKRGFIKLVYQNIFMAMQTITQAMDKLEIQYGSPENTENAGFVENVHVDEVKTFEPPYVIAIKKLWADSGIQECYNRRNKYQLTESTKYFLDDIDRVAAPNYLPTEQDILRVRVPTTGIIEYPFVLKERKIKIRMVDVGGQRNERKKWLHCFENVSMIIFIAALSEYDQVLAENDDNQNRMTESRNLFKSIIEAKWFQYTPIILFLNKQDVFKEKIKTSHLADYDPRYTGPKENAEAAQSFIMEIYQQCVPKDREFFPHFTTATDTKNIEVVFGLVRQIILKTFLRDALH